MVKVDENALICDLAETYHIYDYKQIAPQKVAIFAIGLREDSRIKMKMSGQKYDNQTIMIGEVIDRLSFLVWAQTKNASKGINRPKPFLGDVFEKEKEISAFNSGKDFDEERQRILAERR